MTLSGYAKKVSEKDVLKVINKVLKEENKESKKIKELIPLVIENDTVVCIGKFKNTGVVIISADDVAPPVLGVCWNGEYDIEKMPPGLVGLIEKYKNTIKNMQIDGVEADSKTRRKWDRYLDKGIITIAANTMLVQSSVSPLMSTLWEQSYNQYCPSNSPAGCEAIAMAQILYYWNISVSPTGSNTHDGESAIFGQTEYCWSSMNKTSSNDDNALLIYHAGVSCDTDYDTNGSSSTISKAEDGYQDYWGMHTDLKSRFWNLNNWEDMLKSELDNGRPIHYAGHNILGKGHAWVIDGYNSSDQFYCNWGWGSDYNDYYSLGNFYLSGHNLNEYEQAIFALYPENIYNLGTITGPTVLTTAGGTYTLTNPADCAYVT
ncbi:MAG: C10 family peptidase [Prolixibacteraceae bacterium]|nr:C10 family peptidase [Prolixibacteraceae bacterium]